MWSCPGIAWCGVHWDNRLWGIGCSPGGIGAWIVISWRGCNAILARHPWVMFQWVLVLVGVWRGVAAWICTEDVIPVPGSSVLGLLPRGHFQNKNVIGLRENGGVNMTRLIKKYKTIRPKLQNYDTRGENTILYYTQKLSVLKIPQSTVCQ